MKITIFKKNRIFLSFLILFAIAVKAQNRDSVLAGKIDLKPGEFVCTLKGKEFSGNQYLNPIAIRLEKVR